MLSSMISPVDTLQIITDHHQQLVVLELVVLELSRKRCTWERMQFQGKALGRTITDETKKWNSTSCHPR